MNKTKSPTFLNDMAYGLTIHSFRWSYMCKNKGHLVRYGNEKTKDLLEDYLGDKIKKNSITSNELAKIIPLINKEMIKLRENKEEPTKFLINTLLDYGESLRDVESGDLCDICGEEPKQCICGCSEYYGK